MPQFVRAGLRHNRWLETDGREPLDFPADVLSELRTTDNQLSVFELTEAVGAERIAIAFFASGGKNQPDHTAYGVFDRSAVEGLGITFTKTPGDTPDATVNGLHYDLDVGTAAKLVQLAGVIAVGQIVPILKNRVVELLRMGFENGQLDHTKNPTLCDRVKAKVPGRDHKSESERKE